MTCFLITGISGNVGVALVRELARTRPDAEAHVVMRARDDTELMARWTKTLAAAGLLHPSDLPRFRPLRGDVSQPDLGLARADLDAIVAETTDIVNSASLTNFAAPSALLAPPNIGGLVNLLAVARRCRALRGIAHLGTCFVAGRREGLIREDDLEHDAGFVNAYERSKYDAELIARRAMADLPLAVYRLSLLIGQRDGYIHRPGAFHFFLQKLYAGLLPLIPGHADSRFDMLPTDYAVEVLASLFLDHFETGRTYHIAAGEDAPTTLEWLALTTRLFETASPAWCSGAHVQPDLVDVATYRHLVDTVHTVGNRTMFRMLEVIDALAEYPLSKKIFDRANVRNALAGAMPVPTLASYYPSIIEVGTRTGFASSRTDALD